MVVVGIDMDYSIDRLESADNPLVLFRGDRRESRIRHAEREQRHGARTKRIMATSDLKMRTLMKRRPT